MDMDSIRAKAADTALENSSFFSYLTNEVIRDNIDLYANIYKLSIEDILVVLVDEFRDSIASGKLDLNECIKSINLDMEIPWDEYVKEVVDEYYLKD